jgi:hypothetical protein
MVNESANIGRHESDRAQRSRSMSTAVAGFDPTLERRRAVLRAIRDTFGRSGANLSAEDGLELLAEMTEAVCGRVIFDPDARASMRRLASLSGEQLTQLRERVLEVA